MSLFSFALDGKVDMSSINPLEMTNFEATATVAAVIAIIVTLIWDLTRARRLQGLDRSRETVFVPVPAEEEAGRPTRLH